MFNMIVTTRRHMEDEADSEIIALLGEIGDNSPIVKHTGLSGLLTCTTKLDPLVVVKKIRSILQENPWRLRYILRLIPVDIVVDTDIVDIKNTAENLSKKIMPNETFRITVEKRQSDIESMEIVKEIADVIERKVSLDKQDWVVLVEVIGNETGVSVLRPESIFSAVKEKRASP